MAESKCGHPHFLFYSRKCNWELSERLHHADSRRFVDRQAWFAVPAVRDTNQALRQRPDIGVDVAARKVPFVRTANFADVSADRANDGFAVRSNVLEIRNHPTNGKVAVFHLLNHRSNDHGLAGTNLAGCSELARIRGRTGILWVCPSRRRPRLRAQPTGAPRCVAFPDFRSC